MLLELLYLSIVIVTGFQAQLLVRRGGPAQRSYVFMLLVDLGLALAAFIAGRSAEPPPWAGAVGAVAIGGFVFLVMLPRTLHSLARRALAGERLHLAMRLLDLKELLQPGLGAKQERDYVAAIADVRDGRVDRALESLKQQRQQMENPLVRRAIDDRIVMTLLYARRWREAIDAFEKTRDADGQVTGQLLAEVVRAYGELGELDQAARLLEKLERSPAAREPAWSFVMSRARMVYLAFVGRPAEVEALVSAGPLGMLPPTVRLYWIGTAKLHAGDREGARTTLGEAMRVAGADDRAREITAERLAAVDDPLPELPRALSTEVVELADRLAKSEPPAPAERVDAAPRMEMVPFKAIPATLALIGVNLVVALFVAWRLGSSVDAEVLSRAGANVGSAVRVGEYWRLISSVFVHVGTLHLVINMYGLWVLGRLMEQILGSTRLFVVYSLAGIGGAAASVLAARGTLSAGASGAVLGLLGAAVAELALRRNAYPERWRRSLLGILIFLTVLQIAIGFAYPIIDQSAHLGGMVVGALATAVLSPKARFGATRTARVVSAILFVGLLGATAWSGVMAATTTTAESLAKGGWTRVTIGQVELEVPRIWSTADGVVRDPTSHLSPTVTAKADELLPAMELERRADEHLADLEQQAKKSSDVVSAERVEPSVDPGANWATRELRVVLNVDEGPRVYREGIFVRRFGAHGITVVTFVPERRLGDLAPVLERVVASARHVRAP